MELIPRLPPRLNVARLLARLKSGVAKSKNKKAFFLIGVVSLRYQKRGLMLSNGKMVVGGGKHRMAPWESYSGDVFLYFGDINREGYHQISTVLESREEKKQKACLVLITYGGDPDAAYRIARAAHHHYPEVEVLIPDICKSAGTLLCIGANNLIFGDRGELGPLDIQLSKPDEMFESMSGLDIIQALSALQNQVQDAFSSYLLDIRTSCRIRTKMAADIAAKLADGFIEPIAAKIDPITLGEHQRAMQIAYDYGKRLDEMAQSLKPRALASLIGSYPSHSFVIDRKEATSLFKRVVAPDQNTIGIYHWARNLVETTQHPQRPIVCDVLKDLDAAQQKALEEQQHEPQSHSSGDEPAEEQGPSGASTGESKEDESPAGEQDQSRASRSSTRRKK